MSRRALAAGLLLFVAGALAFVGATLTDDPARALSDDAVEYLGLARNLSLEHRFVSHYHPGQPELYRTPLFPALLAGLRAWESIPRLRLAIVVQLLLAAAAAVVIGRIIRQLDLRRPWVVGMLYLLSPVVLVHSAHLGSEALFVFLAVLSAWLLVIGRQRASARALAASGLCLGLATLARPVGIVLLLPALFLLVRHLHRPALRTQVLVWLLAAAAIPSAWSVRNGLAGGFWGLSMSGPSYVSSVLGSGHLEAGEEGFKTSIYEREGFGAAAADVARAVARHPGRAVSALALGSARTLFGPGEWTLRRALLGESGYRSAQAPGSRYRLDASPAGLQFSREEVAAGARERSLAGWLLLAWSLLSLAIVYLLGLCGLFKIVRSRSPLAGLWIAAALLLTLASAGYDSSSRFRLPALPFILLTGAHCARLGSGERRPDPRGNLP